MLTDFSDLKDSFMDDIPQREAETLQEETEADL